MVAGQDECLGGHVDAEKLLCLTVEIVNVQPCRKFLALFGLVRTKTANQPINAGLRNHHTTPISPVEDIPCEYALHTPETGTRILRCLWTEN